MEGPRLASLSLTHVHYVSYLVALGRAAFDVFIADPALIEP